MAVVHNDNKEKSDVRRGLWNNSDWKAVIVSCISLFIWFLFEPYFITIWDKYIVFGFLSKTNDSELFFVIGICFMLFSVILFGVKSYKKHRTFIPYKYLVFGVAFILFYLIYRFQGIYVYYPNYCGFGILDLIVFSVCVAICRASYVNAKQVLSFTPKYDENMSVFYHDRPIDDDTEDSLGFSLSVKEFYSTIQNTWAKNVVDKNYKSFSIGITGGWGEGKSSFVSLLIKEFDTPSKEYIVIKFNPRHAKSRELIQYEFFQLLYEKLKEYDMRFSSTFSNYLKAINVIDDKGIFNFIRQGHDAVFDKEDEKEAINKALVRINKKVVVVIDDLDRLLDDEIIEVCKLLDGNASFDNMLFITAYDKGYVNSILKDYDHGTGSFIDKFFSIEKSIPFVSRLKYQEIISNRIAEFYNDNKLKEEINLVTDCLNGVIFSYRDVKRFLNIFIDEYSKRIGYVSFSDLFLLILIKYRWEDCYIKIRNMEIIKESSLERRDSNDENDVITRQFILNKDSLLFLERQKNKESLSTILNKLFGKEVNVSYYSLNNPILLSTYFYPVVNEVASPIFYEKMFNSILYSNKTAIEEINRHNLDDYFVDYLVSRNVNLFERKEQFLNYLELCFYYEEKMDVVMLTNKLKDVLRTFLFKDIETLYFNDVEEGQNDLEKLLIGDFENSYHLFVYKMLSEILEKENNGNE